MPTWFGSQSGKHQGIKQGFKYIVNKYNLILCSLEKAEVDDIPADFNRENECDDGDDDYEVRWDGAGAVPIVNMNDNPPDSINFVSLLQSLFILILHVIIHHL